MTFAKWLELSNIDDAKAARMFARDRAHISKLRRGKVTPSYELMLSIRDKTDGAVTLDSWAPEPARHSRKGRVAAA
jgi:hypothetical protein